jgi:CRP-like cAMP-binding protein
MDNLNAWMDEVCIPAEMRSELRQYFHHTRSLARENTYRRLLSHMSPTLRMRVASHCHSAWVREVAFLASSRVPKVERDTFVMELSLRLVPVSFAPDEAIIRHNEPANTLYIVKRGLIIRSLPQFKLQAGCDFRVGSPKVIGEDFIMTRYFRPYSVRTLTFLDGYSLDKRVIEQLLRHDEFPNTKAVLRRHTISSALKAKLPALALTFALMSRVRYGSISSHDDDDDDAEDDGTAGDRDQSCPESYSDAEAAEIEGIEQQDSAEVFAVSAVAAAAVPPRSAAPAHSRQGSIPSRRQQQELTSTMPSSSHPVPGSARSARSSSGKPSPSQTSGVAFFPPAATPSVLARRGSNMSASSTGRLPSSLDEHAIAKQVTSHWEGAKVLLTAMERDAPARSQPSSPACSQPSSPARAASFSLHSNRSHQAMNNTDIAESTGLHSNEVRGLRRTSSESSAFRSQLHSEEDRDAADDNAAAGRGKLQTGAANQLEPLAEPTDAREHGTSYSSALSGTSTPDWMGQPDA